MSRTTVVVTRAPPGSTATPARVRVETSGPRGRAHLAARLLGVRGDTVRIALVAEGALLLAGDEVDLRLQVGDGCRLEVVEPAGTVAYDMRGGTASWRVAVDVRTGGELVWSGEPLVVGGGADVTRTLTVTLEGSATACLREVVVLGRAREAGGRIRQSTTVLREGHPVHREDLDLDGERPRVGVLSDGVRGDLRVIDTVSVLGRRAPVILLTEGAHRLDLEAEATIVRALGAQTHVVSLDAVWAAVRPAVATLTRTTLSQEDSLDPRSAGPHDVRAAGVGHRSWATAAP